MQLLKNEGMFIDRKMPGILPYNVSKWPMAKKQNKKRFL